MIRLRTFWCRWFGHAPKRNRDGFDLCERCHCLLSTPLSRARVGGDRS